jgi:hypothetical protein
MPIFWLFENAYIFAREVQKNPIFCLSPIRRTSGRKKFLFSDAWAIAEAYVGFCVGFTYTPSPVRRTLL